MSRGTPLDPQAPNALQTPTETFADPLHRPWLTACTLTPRGRGAVAVLGLRGHLTGIDSLFLAANRRAASQQPVGRICYGLWGTAPGEDVVFLRTSPTEAEIHCHGGVAAVERIEKDLRECGARVESSDAWIAGQQSICQTECELALIQATTRRTAELLLRQATLFPQALADLPRHPESVLQRIDEMLSWSRFGEHLAVPWEIVLCGRPNVGKSSLINALVGFQRSIVFDQPGTTRDVVSAETAFDGWPVRLSDTAGLRSADDLLESEGIERTRRTMHHADLALVILDARQGLTPDDESLLSELPDSLVVWNKIDLAPVAPEVSGTRNAVCVSAVRGDGIADLIQRIVERLVPSPPPQDATYPVTPAQSERLRRIRQLAADGATVAWQEDLQNWIALP